MNLKYKAIISIIGFLLIIESAFMFLCLFAAFFFGENAWKAIALSALTTVVAGGACVLLTKGNTEKELRKRDGYLAVTLSWLAITFFGTLPYLLTGSIADYSNIFFETMSGFTTTGASILDDIESLPKSILLWRSITQWLGGMGIIVMAVAILPILGIGGMQLFVAEAPGISADKLAPRIKETAKRLWMIYVGLTLLEVIMLNLAGMSYFDSLNHALTTISTAGFSTKQASLGHWDSAAIHYIIIFFMLVSATNFTLIWFTLFGKGSKLLNNEEFQIFWKVIAILCLIIGCVIFGTTQLGVEESFRTALFQVASIVTTTGYTTADYTSWTSFTTLLFFSMFFLGACAGSTAGGVKIIRHVVMLKNGFLEFKRQLHPKAVIPVRLNGKAVSEHIVYNILAFMVLYILIFSIGTIVMAAMNMDIVSAMGSVAATLGNVGPGIGSVGPASSFSEVPDAGKWFLSVLMLLGRLELFTVLILFTPAFWRRD